MRHSFSIWSLISGLLLIGFFLIPNSLERSFDGLPWSAPVEFLAVGIILPWLFLLNTRWLRQAPVGLSLLVLFVLKIALSWMTPSAGWDIWVYTSQSNMAVDRWQRTYSTLLTPGVSAHLEKGWSDQREFPIEWVNDKKSDKEKLWVGVRWEGYLRLPADSQLVIVAEGITHGDVTIKNDDGSALELPIVQKVEDLEGVPFIAGERTAQIAGQLCFSGAGNWSLVPLIRRGNGSYAETDDAQVLWGTHAGAELSAAELKTLVLFSYALDWAMIVFLVCWFVNVFIHSQRASLLLGLTVGGLSLMIQPVVLPLITQFDGTGITLVGFWILLIGLLSLLTIRRSQDTHTIEMSRTSKWPLWVFAPMVFAHFMVKWWDEVGRMQFMSSGDDWLTYQVFARQIFVEGDWLHRARPVFLYQPLYRYIVGAMHVLFGQSSISLYLLNVWTILAIAMIIIGLVKAFQGSRWIALAVSWSYLVIMFSSSYRHQIEHGLQEFAALLFLMLTAYMLVMYRNNRTNCAYMILAFVFALIATWVRLDHVVMVMALGTLLLGPLQGRTKNAWRLLFQSAWRNRKTLLTYLSIIAAGLLLVVLRNYFLGGEVILTRSQLIHADYVPKSLLGHLKGVVIVLTGKPSSWQSYSLLRLSGTLLVAIILWSGTILSVLGLVVRRGWLQTYHLSLGFILIGGIIPYTFVLPMAYLPRYSIHILPWAMLSLALGFDLWRRRAEVAQLVV